MADELTLEDLEEIDTDGNPTLKSVRDAATRHAKTAREGQAEITQLKREIALRDAGIDLKSGVGKIFAERYEGAVDKADVVATAYLEFKKELGVPEAAAAEVIAGEGTEGETLKPSGEGKTGTEGTGTEGEPNGTDARRSLQTGAGPADGTNPGAEADIRRRGEVALAEGATFEEAGAGIVNAIANGWKQGDIQPLDKGRRPSPATA